MNAYVEAVTMLRERGFVTDELRSQLTPEDLARAVAEAGAAE